MADLTSQYEKPIEVFQQNAFEVLVMFVAVCAVLGLACWLAEKLDKIERKYRVKRHIRGPRDE